eukprot:gb/GECG01011806.1/.p1 GENE.gb/GECG01011806.1/~~gb/GECG01011806.1/.p1  ORF type:complete len:153 (+),score=16.98 gb/GECG01011806.1/:1-459(+)
MAADPRYTGGHNNDNDHDIELSEDDSSSLSDGEGSGDYNLGAPGPRHEPMKQKQTPEDIECPVEPMDIAFHPTHDVLASGLINGEIYLHHYTVPTEPEQGAAAASTEDSAASSPQSATRQLIYTHGKPETSIRCLEFNQDGRRKWCNCLSLS